MKNNTNMIRPANFAAECPGSGVTTFNCNGNLIAVVNIQGRVFMKEHLDCPFKVMDTMLSFLKHKTNIIIVDMHAEATAEKICLGFYLDGRVSCVVGTHTHVATADERILPNGTAYITDLGMAGPYKSVLGRDIDRVIKAIITQMPTRFDVAEKDVRMSGAIITIDSSTGKALEIKRLVLHDSN